VGGAIESVTKTPCQVVTLMMPEHSEQDDDGQRNTQKPQQYTTSESHGGAPLYPHEFVRTKPGNPALSSGMIGSLQKALKQLID
jgi:hypothetical protein